jgi:hypothetical protein
VNTPAPIQLVDEPQSVPSVVTEFVEELREATGHQPRVTRLDARCWRLTLTSEAVMLTLDYRLLRPRRLYWVDSSLVVNGKRRELAKDFDHLLAVFTDPDCGQRQQERSARTEPEPMPPRCPVQAVPRDLRQIYAQVCGQVDNLGGQLIEVQVGHVGQHWTIGVDIARFSMRMNFKMVRTRSSRPGKITPDRLWPIEVFVDGVNRSDEVGGSLDKALALFDGFGR